MWSYLARPDQVRSDQVTTNIGSDQIGPVLISSDQSQSYGVRSGQNKTHQIISDQIISDQRKTQRLIPIISTISFAKQPFHLEAEDSTGTPA